MKFLISLALHLIFRAEWLVLAVLCFLLHHFFNFIPVWIGWGLLGIWLLSAILVTCGFRLLDFIGGKSDAPKAPQENKNPYSHK